MEIVHTYGSELPVRADVLAEILEGVGLQLYLDVGEGEYKAVDVSPAEQAAQHGFPVTAKRNPPVNRPSKDPLKRPPSEEIDDLGSGSIFP